MYAIDATIYATDINNGLAKNGAIPWHSSQDMKFFKNKTKHNVVVMGRNTYLSLKTDYLPMRLNIVLTKNQDEINRINSKQCQFLFATDNFDILQNKTQLQQLFPYLKENFTIFCIGGKQLYESVIPTCIWATTIKQNYDCDLFFIPELSTYNAEIIEDNEELTITKYTKKEETH